MRESRVSRISWINVRVIIPTQRWRAVVVAAVLTLPAVAAAGQGPSPEPEPTQPTTGAPKVVEEGLFPKSFRIPGTDLSLGIGGYVKVDFIQDLDPIGDAFEFRTNSIPAEGSAAASQSGQTTIHARETRVNLDLRSEGADGHAFRAFVEGDFFGDKNAFRLRHAYGEFGPILGGQTWSTFQDISARPLTVDFEGPDGEVFVRQAMIRYTHRVGTHWSMAVAVEQPTPQFAVPGAFAGSARTQMPDIPGFVRYQQGRGHVQVAGMVRQLRFDSTDASADDVATAGWGMNATFAAPGGGRNLVQGGFVIGEGVARYIEALSGQNLDARLSDAGDLSAIRTQAATLGYTIHWAPDLKSGVAYSTARVEDAPGLAGSAIDRIQDVRASLWYTPYRLVDFAGELLWGRRTNQDGSRGDAVRVQFAVIYRLS